MTNLPLRTDVEHEQSLIFGQDEVWQAALSLQLHGGLHIFPTHAAGMDGACSCGKGCTEPHLPDGYVLDPESLGDANHLLHCMRWRADGGHLGAAEVDEHGAVRVVHQTIGPVEFALANDCRQESGRRRKERAAELCADQPQGYLRPTGLGDFDYEFKRAMQDLGRRAAGGGGGAVRKPYFVDAADLLNQSPPAVAWLINGLLRDQAVTVIGGEPKACKSWLGIELALALATGTRALGKFGVREPRQTFVFCVEDDARSLRTRLGAFCRARKASADHLKGQVFIQPRGELDLMNPEQLAHMIAAVRVRSECPGLVVLDPLVHLHRVEENSAAMASVMGALRALRDILGCAVIVVHHAGKRSEARDGRRAGQQLRGSSAIHGALDGLLFISDHEVSQGVVPDEVVFRSRVEVETKAARSVAPFAMALNVIDDTAGEAVRAEFSVMEASSRDEARSAEILEELSDGPKSANAIQRKLGCRKDAVTRCLETLRKAGKVSHDATSKRPWSLVTETKQ